MAETIKLGEVSKNIKITNKDIIAKLSEYGVDLKSSASVVSEDIIGLILDIYTQVNEVTPEELDELRADALKKAEKEAQKKAAEAVEAAAKEEKKAPEEKKPAAKAEEKKKTAEKAEEQPKAKQEKHKKVAKKQSGQKIVLSNMDRTNTEEEYIVKTEERKRHVDTRQTVVELETIESRERIENMVPDNMKMDKKGAKAKNKRVGKDRRREKDKQSQPKHEIKPKVITEIEVPEAITVGELASRMGKKSAEIVKKLMMLGVMATQNQSIDFDTAQLIGMDFGIEVKQEIVLTKEDILMSETEHEDKAEELVSRPPVVVVMGHVDHGKTSLLDAIRHTSVIETEAGGITQHIGAYSVKLNDRRITFLDTPGHEAFTTMRARGAQVTDVAILVVAADDGIMPQTIEAINHAKAAGVTIVVAINKIDKDGANPERIRQALVEYDLVPEEWGGDTICVEISAKKRINIDGLLEMVLLVADMQE